MQPLRPAIRRYPWGSTTLIPELAGQPATGDHIAELWFGAHTAGPAHVVASDDTLISLGDYIAADPHHHLGARVHQHADGRLPFMLKLLAADEPLSLQAHPTRAEAEAGFARENAAGLALDDPQRNYKDPNHKPELIVALTRFRALAGFRPIARTQELFAVLDCSELAPYVEILASASSAGESEQLHALFRRWVTLADDVREGLIRSVVDVASTILADDSACESVAEWILDSLRTVVDLQRRYPGDIGVLSALLLHHVTLEPGQAICLKSGQLHAYLEGMGVEIMANSDNVLRGGLTEKHVDVPELLEVLDFSSVQDPIVEPYSSADGRLRYPAHSDEFVLERVELTCEQPTLRCGHDGPAIVLVTRGAVRCEDQIIRPTEAVWLPAGAAETEFAVAGGEAGGETETSAELFIART
ncbi:mannose-6-phosphate isomerase, class I [Corynebacterium propinquum]|uniref:mannose-6-phosphate isomerase n=1 Tax=Corynebacterium propinquum TaxID=43769 RepID=A0AAP4BUU5_9CORY|nr:mannose-6-phosphate isomerase, class I [Corynebacterium propinquum]MDK4258274.1 mannose-6-phosphate isomerase, class I [Corynebacterium propinquum]MDK4281587.1 mannose-6-phosphate isomerase, class I [Corynebacterium propinquum]MDK4298964.1 mannose-6-phosphate isomerase, class I [Corynebacterium propinquum]MDK4326879.1 mannose-6-phosphate isomerase, class I [Corynebacterium propinquum]MDK8665672.1 mannose-6-phosphate isomerase, class I [Corynebacterium propinquum]